MFDSVSGTVRPGRRGPLNLRGNTIQEHLYQECREPVPPAYEEVHRSKIQEHAERVEAELVRLGIAERRRVGQNNRKRR